MSNAYSGTRRGIDWITLSIYLCLVIVGWLMIYTVGYEDGYQGDISSWFSRSIGRQTIWVGISFISIFLLFSIDWKLWQTFSYLLYAVAMMMLVAVLFFGVKIKGATSWFAIGGFSFQPSEFAKLATCLALSSYLSAFNTNMNEWRHQLTSGGLIALPMFLILLQPDAGSALVFTGFVIVLYRAGLNSSIYLVGIFVLTLFILALKYPPQAVIFGLLVAAVLALAIKNRKTPYLLPGAVAAIAGAVYLYLLPNSLFAFGVTGIILAGLFFLDMKNKRQRIIPLVSVGLVVGSMLVLAASYFFNNVLETHQQERINVWLNPDKADPRGALYNVLQSKMAIGSGGLQGKGFLKGVMTKLDYVPEQSTDFIFCTIGEEQGFIGSFSIMVFFLLFLFRLITLAERQRSSFSRYYCYGVASIIFVHFFINIGMTMGLVPIIGIPLPFISRGGSSLLIFSIMVGIALKLDSNRFRI